MTVVPAALGESPSGQASGVPYSPLYDDVYHAVAGAWAQARHVFLAGNGLPERWQGRQRFVILETGFGLGNNFLTTWASWLRDDQACPQLIFISIEKHPLRADDLRRVHGLLDAEAPAGITDLGADTDQPDRRMLAQRLVEAWPTLTPGLHTLHFEHEGGRRITLLLGLGDIAQLLPALVAQVDAFYLDGFAPAKNPQMWDEGLLSRLNRLAAPGATAATWSAARGVRDALGQAGFQVKRAPGFAGKRDMIQATYAPRYHAPPLAGGIWPEPAAQRDRHALVVGAGLAGCATAWALCRLGWRVTLLDRHAHPAGEGSGNPGGMFHSILHAEDGIHARAHRAAALATWRQARCWLDQGRFAGLTRGLLRLDGRVQAGQAAEWLSRQCLPADHVRWVSQEEASAISGLPVPSGGWLFAQAGWLHPAGLAGAMLDEAAALRDERGAPLLDCRWQTEVGAIRQDETTGDWQAWAEDRPLAQAPSLILCGAHQTGSLLATLRPDQAVAVPPTSAVRGQITQWSQTDSQRGRLPHMPVAGSGYVLTLADGSLLCGATTQHHDADPMVREADHRHNLSQAARLGALPPLDAEAPLPAGLSGRTGWRATTPDRLPLVGALPWSSERLQATPSARRLDQVRLLPRARHERGGLYTVSGLGSRGITWSCLAAELIAHWVAGTPCPVEADLRDALDPARFLVRQLIKDAKEAPGPADRPSSETVKVTADRAP